MAVRGSNSKESKQLSPPKYTCIPSYLHGTPYVMRPIIPDLKLWYLAESQQMHI